MRHTDRESKERLTVSLSRGSLKYLKVIRSQCKAPSMSALFERIVSDLQAKTELEQLDEKMDAYYDSLSESAIQEDRAWGALGEAALASQTTEEENEPQLAVAGH